MRPGRCAKQSITARFLRRPSDRPSARLIGCVAPLAFAALAWSANIASADEGGVSFWIPGFFGSLAAAPQQPGWSWASIYYHTSVSGNGALALAKEFQIKNVPVSFSGQANVNVKGTGDLGFVAPSYVFATPVLGGQASATIIAAYGRSSASWTGL